MRVIEFPLIIPEFKHKIADNPFAYGALCAFPLIEPCISLTNVIAAGVENTGKFIGATIDVYADSARKNFEAAKRYSNHDFLRSIVYDMSPIDKAFDPRIYGVVLRKNKKNSVEKILRNGTEMHEFFDPKKGFLSHKLDKNKLSRTIFVPSPSFTQYAFGFIYDEKKLESVIDFSFKKV